MFYLRKFNLIFIFENWTESLFEVVLTTNVQKSLTFGNLTDIKLSWRHPMRLLSEVEITKIDIYVYLLQYVLLKVR